MNIPSKKLCDNCQIKKNASKKIAKGCEACKKINSELKRRIKPKIEEHCYVTIYKYWTETYKQVKEATPTESDLSIRTKVKTLITDKHYILKATDLCSDKWLVGIWEKAINELSSKLAEYYQG